MKTINLQDRMDGEIRHPLRRCGKLTLVEIGFLTFVASYSQGCKISYDEIAYILDISRSKVERIVKALVGYGLITRTYRFGKKVTLKIAPARVQIEFAAEHQKPPFKNKNDTGDTSSMTDQGHVTHDVGTRHPRRPDTSPVTCPLLERDLERNLETGLGLGSSDEEGKVPSRGQIGDVARLLQETMRRNSEVSAAWQSPQRAAGGAQARRG